MIFFPAVEILVSYKIYRVKRPAMFELVAAKIHLSEPTPRDCLLFIERLSRIDCRLSYRCSFELILGDRLDRIEGSFQV